MIPSATRSRRLCTRPGRIPQNLRSSKGDHGGTFGALEKQNSGGWSDWVWNQRLTATKAWAKPWQRQRQRPKPQGTPLALWIRLNSRQTPAESQLPLAGRASKSLGQSGENPRNCRPVPEVVVLRLPPNKLQDCNKKLWGRFNMLQLNNCGRLRCIYSLFLILK